MHAPRNQFTTTLDATRSGCQERIRIIRETKIETESIAFGRFVSRTK